MKEYFFKLKEKLWDQINTNQEFPQEQFDKFLKLKRK